MRFEFATATRIIFGAGTLCEVGPLAKAFGRHALVVTSRDAHRADPLMDLLNKTENVLSATICRVPDEPTLHQVENDVRVAKAAGCDFVIAFGGGSAIDAGKAVAAMLANDGELLDYMEVIGRGRSLEQPSVPFIAIPTTAGTGSEVTRNAVLASPEHKVKVSLRSPLMLPKVALVDPELTYGLPPAVTASTGLDALTQLIEPYVSWRANPMTDALCVEGIRRSARSLPTACHNGHDKAAREDIAVASLFGGLALANAGLGAVHGFAAPIGGAFPAPHGAVCAILLPLVMTANVRALRSRAPAGETLRRYEEIARLVTGNPAATVNDGLRWTADVVTELGIPGLNAYGIRQEHVAELVGKAAGASSMKGNPIALTTDEMMEVLRAAI